MLILKIFRNSPTIITNSSNYKIVYIAIEYNLGGLAKKRQATMKQQL